ncbi:MAG: hemerythrin domain-containing protein [Candidatus Pacearchaeota archaeon]|jgi:hemerythrin-like domain-containing protein|nr:hemerythrin domain-containing protein [Candidatus Pacearchaeota archaeon]
MLQSIEKLMLKEHKRLDKFLDDFERDLDDFEKTKKNCDCFKWNMEKHFFVEEKIIFDSFVDISGQETNDTFHLLEDHVRIIQILKALEDKLKQKIKPKLEYLRRVIKTHRDFEDEDFYPKLDKRLSDEQKEQVAERIKEIIPC